MSTLAEDKQDEAPNAPDEMRLRNHARDAVYLRAGAYGCSGSPISGVLTGAARPR
jgi:hypothetical protein